MNVIISNKYQEMLASIEIEVIKSMNGVFEVDEIIQTFSNFFFQRMILDITAIKDYKDISNIQKLSINLDMSKIILVLDDDPESSSSSYLSQLISMGIYNFTRNRDGLIYLLEHPNTYRDVAHIHQLNTLTEEVHERVNIAGSQVILGIKNVTSHAGATTLIYMLKQQLSKDYQVLAIEVNKNDFLYFNDKDMISVGAGALAKEIIKRRDAEIILVDLNDLEDDGTCNDILYLMEPSTIKLNKLMRRDRRIFERLEGKKIVLNQSLLEQKDVLDFEYESKSRVYYNIPPLDDKRKDHSVISSFLGKLGFVRQVQNPSMQQEDGNKIFGIFKNKY